MPILRHRYNDVIAMLMSIWYCSHSHCYPVILRNCRHQQLCTYSWKLAICICTSCCRCWISFCPQNYSRKAQMDVGTTLIVDLLQENRLRFHIASCRGVHLQSKECLCKRLHAYEIRSYDHCWWVVGAVVIRRRFTWNMHTDMMSHWLACFIHGVIRSCILFLSH